LRRFLKERWEHVSGAETDCDGTLHSAYKLWCEVNGHRPMTKTSFHQKLCAADPSIEVKRLGGRGRQRWVAIGIKLKPEDHEEEAAQDGNEHYDGDRK
jgi:phage/plasmid-associated DNA primase